MSIIYDIVILVTGSRDWDDFNKMELCLKKYYGKKVLLIHGNCRGADKISEIVGRKLKFDILSKSAEWKKYGKQAGILRNIEMIKELLVYKKSGVQTIVLAFHSDIENSKGTKHCVNECKKYNLEILLTV